jgi:hypothetical protein
VTDDEKREWEEVAWLRKTWLVFEEMRQPRRVADDTQGAVPMNIDQNGWTEQDQMLINSQVKSTPCSFDVGFETTLC